jgi:outer membrane receptor for ferric coprogen and ferric-rhodotorulic acid
LIGGFAASTSLGLAGLAKAEEVPANKTIILEPIDVVGSGYDTEDSGSYASDLVSVGEKDARTVREVPQSTTVLTNEYLKDRNVTTLDTALRKAPGIVVLDNDNGRSSIFSRGFEVDKLYFNGLSAPVSSRHGTQPDMSIIDHVEILKGPAGLFDGAGEPGGAINMSLKRPTREFAASVEASGNTWGGIRGVGDISSPLTEEGTLRARVVATRDQNKTWVDNNDNDTSLGYLVIEGDVTEDDMLTFSVSRTERDLKPFNGLPSFANGTLIDLDTSTTTGADWNEFESGITDLMGEYEHLFENGGHLKLSGLYSERTADSLYAYSRSAAAANGNISGITVLGEDFEETSLSLDAHISQPVELFGQEHNILAGVDYKQNDSTSLSNGRGVANGDTNNIFNWNTNLTIPAINYTTQQQIETNQYGVYGQVRIKPFDPLTLIGGLRSTWYESANTNLLTGVETSQTIDAELTPYAGAVYDFTQNLSAYGSYTEIFQPQTDTDVNGDLIGSRTGRQYEIGLKGNYQGLNASVALFDLVNENYATDADGINATVGDAGADIKVRGFEMEASGSVMPGLEVMAGYTYSLVSYVSGPDSIQSLVLRGQTPKHQLQIWAKQDIDLIDGLYLGGGMKAFSGANNGTIKREGYAIFDAMAGYDVTENLSTTLTVNNLFDKKYYSRTGSTTLFNFYGEPRSALLKVTAKF